MGRILRKEADDVINKWDRLNTDSADWQRRLELGLNRLMELQEAEDLLDGQLRQAEMVKEAWEPVGDLLIDSLPEHIDRVKVRHKANHQEIRNKITKPNTLHQKKKSEFKSLTTQRGSQFHNLLAQN